MGVVIYLSVCICFLRYWDVAHAIIDLSNQNLEQVPTGLDPTETVVELWNNQLTSLDGRLDHLTSLEYLVLTENKFTAIPNVAAFASTLKGLYLGMNLISTVNPSDFDHMTNLIELALYGNGMAVFPDISPVGDTLKILEIGENLFSAVPDMIMEKFVVLEEVDMMETPIQTFPNLTSSAGTLTYVNLNSISLASWDVSGYPELAVLHKLTINGNQLTAFPDLSPAADQVEQLYLRGNQMSQIDPARLHSFKRMKKLFLYHNQFTLFPDLSPLGTLTYLDVHDNLIQTVNPAFLPSKLATLKMNGNRLTVFPDLAPIGNYLRFLYLGDNFISSIDPSLLSPLVKLQTLKLNNNKFKYFPDLTALNSTLESLLLEENEIISICNARIQHLKSLTSLYLKYNKLRHFPNISPLDSLMIMDIAGNYIAFVPKQYLQGLPNLEQLRLTGNKIKVMPDISSVQGPLSSLEIHDNPIEEISVEALLALEGHDMRFTLLSRTMPEVCFQQATHIELRGSHVEVCKQENHWMKEPGCNLTLTVPGLTCPGAALAYDHMTYDDLRQLNVTLPASYDGIQDQDQDSCSKATTRYESGQSCEGLLAVDIGMRTAPDCARQCARSADCQTASFKPDSSLLGQCMLLGSQGQSFHYGQAWEFYGMLDKSC